MQESEGCVRQRDHPRSKAFMKVEESEGNDENVEVNGQNSAGKSCMLSRFVTFRMQNLTNLAQIWLEGFGKIQQVMEKGHISTIHSV